VNYVCLCFGEKEPLIFLFLFVFSYLGEWDVIRMIGTRDLIKFFFWAFGVWSRWLMVFVNLLFLVLFFLFFLFFWFLVRHEGKVGGILSNCFPPGDWCVGFELCSDCSKV